MFMFVCDSSHLTVLINTLHLGYYDAVNEAYRNSADSHARHGYGLVSELKVRPEFGRQKPITISYRPGILIRRGPFGTAKLGVVITMRTFLKEYQRQNYLRPSLMCIRHLRRAVPLGKLRSTIFAVGTLPSCTTIKLDNSSRYLSLRAYMIF